MRIPTVTLIAVMGLAAAIDAQPNFTAAWPSKVSITDLEVDSSAPGLLPSGATCWTSTLSVHGWSAACVRGRATTNRFRFRREDATA